MPLFSPPIVIQADIRKPNNIKKPVVTQNDSVVLQIEVFENKNPFDLSGAVTVSLASVRKDGVVVTTPGAAVGNVATFNLGTNEVAVTGEVKAKAQFYDTDGRVSTLSFSYLVEQDPTGSGFIPSVDEETLIEFVMNNAQQKIDELSAVDVVDLSLQMAETGEKLKGERAYNIGNNFLFDDTIGKILVKKQTIATENVSVPSNAIIEGIQRNTSQINADKSNSTVFNINSNVYKLSNFTSWGIGKTTKGVVAGSDSLNTRGEIDNVFFNTHDICVDFLSSYINSITRCLFQNSNTGIRIAADSYSNNISRNAFLGVANPLSVNGTTGVIATNMLRFLDNTIEAFNVAVKNGTELIIERAYVGDNTGSSFPVTGEVDKVLDVTAGSTTYVEKSWLGIVAIDQTPNGGVVGNKNFISPIVNFNTQGSTQPTTVEIRGGDIMLSSQNIGTGISQSCLYVSRSKFDRILIDRVKLRVPISNVIHNVVPYLLETDYSPLYSENPMKNYVINGTFQNPKITNYMMTNPLNMGITVSKVPGVVNQYGGEVLRWDNAAVWGDGVGMAFRYRVPAELVGKIMVLEVYSPNVQMSGSNVGVKYSLGTVNSDLQAADGIATYDQVNSLPTIHRNGSKTPYRNVFLVKPTKVNGVIRLDKLFNDPTGVFIEISSITLSEFDNYLYLGQYADFVHPSSVICTTTERPKLPIISEKVYDTTLGKEIWWNGSVWKDSAGTTV